MRSSTNGNQSSRAMKKPRLEASALSLAAVMVAFGAGCADQTRERPGSLGRATFSYECEPAIGDDPYCDFLATDRGFPLLALEGKFLVRATADGALDTKVPVVTAAPSRILFEDGPVQSAAEDGGPTLATALAEGVTSILAESTAADYIDVFVAEPVDLALTEVQIGASGHVTGTIGPLSFEASFEAQRVFVRAAPLDANGEELAGALPNAYAWTTSNPEVVAVESGQDEHLVELSLGESGTSTLEVELGELKQTIEVTVP
jgi:hypothetical protein